MAGLEKGFARRVRVDRRAEERYACDHPDRPYVVEIIFDRDELRNEPSGDRDTAKRRLQQRKRLGLGPPAVFVHRVVGIGEIRIRSKQGKALSRSVGKPTDWPSEEEIAAYRESVERYLAEKGQVSVDWRKVPRKVPEQGRQHESTFYLEILDLFETLKAQGHPRPAAEIADRYGKPRGTVRSWITRARKMKGER